MSRGEINKRHNKKLKGRCPVCGGKVVVAHHTWWWIACGESKEGLPPHIPQVFYDTADECIEAWNKKIEGSD